MNSMTHAFNLVPVDREILALAEMAGETLHTGQFDQTTRITREAMSLAGWTLVRVLTDNKGGNFEDESCEWEGFGVYVHTDGRSVRYEKWDAYVSAQEREALGAAAGMLRTQAVKAQADQSAEKLKAVARINAALEALEAEGCAVNSEFRKLSISSKGDITYRGACKEVGQMTLARRAAALCAQFADKTELEDEVASIIGVLEN